MKSPFALTLLITLTLSSCKKNTPEPIIAENTSKTIIDEVTRPPMQLTNAFKNYWYAGEAEISSFKLEQARYGEIRDGHAVLIYVTEDFLNDKQVKADRQNKSNIPILKLNATKNFNTGIYPYSIMQSIFYPVSNNQHALKISSSMQEWCGHVYTQLNNKSNFELTSHSYFENEADQVFQIPKAILENELWTQLRFNPNQLPQGDLDIVPSFEFVRLKHIQLKAYKAIATMTNNTYKIVYPELNRTLSIQFSENFPYDILGWEETFVSGYGSSAQTLTTKATHLKTIKSPYWSKNSNADENLRKTLELDEH